MSEGEKAVRFAEETKEPKTAESKDLWTQTRERKHTTTGPSFFAMYHDELDHNFDNHLRQVNLQMLSISFAGVFMILLYNDLCYNRDTLAFSDAFDFCPLALYFKLVAWGCYAGFLWRLVAYYKIQSVRKQKLWGYQTASDAFRKSDLIVHFCWEVVLNGIMPFPLTYDTGFQSNLLVGFLVVRIYLVMRALRDFSSVYQARHSISKYMKEAESSDGELHISYGTVFKAYLHTYPIFCVSSIFLVTLLFLSYMMWTVEREFWLGGGEIYKVSQHNYVLPDPDVFSKTPYVTFNNCIWYCIVTMTTLGYGDIFPAAWQGRLIGSLAVLLGIIQTSMIVGVVTNKLNPNESQMLIMTWMRKQEEIHKEQFYAAALVQQTWHHWKNMKSKKKFDVDKFKRTLKSVLRPYVKRFKNARRRRAEIEKEMQAGDEERHFKDRLITALTNLDKRLTAVLEKAKIRVPH